MWRLTIVPGCLDKETAENLSFGNPYIGRLCMVRARHYRSLNVWLLLGFVPTSSYDWVGRAIAETRKINFLLLVTIRRR
jgi:hypothetical protein